MLKDSHDSISTAFAYTQNELDISERPCWYITVGQANYIDEASEFTQVEETFECFYVGEYFNGLEQEYGNYHERKARIASVAAVRYLQRAKRLACIDRRGLVGHTLPSLNNVMFSKIDSRSDIGLKTGKGIEQAYWGFNLSVTVRSVFEEDEDDYMVLNI